MMDMMSPMDFSPKGSTIRPMGIDYGLSLMAPTKPAYTHRGFFK